MNFRGVSFEDTDPDTWCKKAKVKNVTYFSSDVRSKNTRQTALYKLSKTMSLDLECFDFEGYGLVESFDHIYLNLHTALR
jgi:hypothetical protein